MKIAGFIVLVVAVYYLIPSNIALHNKVFANDEKQSSIAGVVVEGMDRSEIQEALQLAMNSWVSKDITISDGNEQIQLDVKNLQFDLEDTIDRYEMLTKKPWYAFWKSKPVAQIPITILPNATITQQIAQIPQWDDKATYNNLVAQAAYFKSHEIEAVLDEFADEVTKEIITFAVESLPDEAFGVNELLEPLNDFTIFPQQKFSFLEALNGQENFANEEALNFMASLLYSVALYTNSEIVERHSQHVIPPYLEPGIEAAVNKYGTKDLQFVNTTNEAIQVKFTIEEENIRVEALATNLIEPVDVRIEEEKEVAPRVITRYSNSLSVGQQQVVQEGKDGLRVAVYRSTSAEDEVLIGKDYYAPLNDIVLKSSRIPEPVQEEQNSSNTAGDFGTSGDFGNAGAGATTVDRVEAITATEELTTSSDILSDSASSTENFSKKKQYLKGNK